MRIICTSLDDMLENLAALDNPANRVFSGVIYVDINRQPVGVDKLQAVKFGVTFQATCVVRLADGSEYLLGCGEQCGYDYQDATNERKGTERAGELRSQLIRYCSGVGLTVRPGAVSE